ncbi:MAG: hypothetical protein JJU02_12805 [Cryomorphaceae bacterium]|nr:hypothetical protein [Cryomorphaceae bacterium]
MKKNTALACFFTALIVQAGISALYFFQRQPFLFTKKDVLAFVETPDFKLKIATIGAITLFVFLRYLSQNLLGVFVMVLLIFTLQLAQVLDLLLFVAFD